MGAGKMQLPGGLQGRPFGGVGVTNQLDHLAPPLGIFIKTSFVFIFSFIHEI